MIDEEVVQEKSLPLVIDRKEETNDPKRWRFLKFALTLALIIVLIPAGIYIDRSGYSRGFAKQQVNNRDIVREKEANIYDLRKRLDELRKRLETVQNDQEKSSQDSRDTFEENSAKNDALEAEIAEKDRSIERLSEKVDGLLEEVKRLRQRADRSPEADPNEGIEPENNAPEVSRSTIAQILTNAPTPPQSGLTMSVWATLNGQEPNAFDESQATFMGSYPVQPSKRDGTISRGLSRRIKGLKPIVKQLALWEFSGSMVFPETGNPIVIMSGGSSSRCDVELIWEGKPLYDSRTTETKTFVFKVENVIAGDAGSFAVRQQCHTGSDLKYPSGEFKFTMTYPGIGKSQPVIDFRSK